MLLFFSFFSCLTPISQQTFNIITTLNRINIQAFHIHSVHILIPLFRQTIHIHTNPFHTQIISQTFHSRTISFHIPFICFLIVFLLVFFPRVLFLLISRINCF
eukprot:GHVO01049639.1.p1 GENE.GHVO01049639.1~~GHVO01049639.1.p1  ORF type:complete len:103 (-),score=1.36 GHVO01049639.1:578-886(-)